MTKENSDQLSWLWTYSILGLLLGALGPVTFFLINIIISEAVTKGKSSVSSIKGGVSLILIVTALSTFVGAVGGLLIGLIQMLLRKQKWIFAVLPMPVFGLIWAVVTGGAGGLPIFVIGAFVGAFVAIPYGIFGFTIFAAVYESLVRRREMRWWENVLLASAVAIPLSLVISLLFCLLLFGKELKGR